ncbi:MAG: cytochrome d ubiquinol oxidase subunit II [Xanthomonadaceae bacterium]|jgi:cytochrome d ubiquinol oxidase subunit II|nr:cytochrome d ubiquinol oxidase subunit II [Xanthomonadaceae bacterium]
MDMIPLDYATLRLVWWLLLGMLFIGFAIADGFDLGVASLLPFVARNDEERRLVINTIGPVWEGNQVWLIVAGASIFAAFPAIYAVSFSGFYLAMFLVLFALILRPVGFKFRSKLPSARWRANWDRALFIGGFIPALIFGVAMGNVVVGVPFHFDEVAMRPVYTGNLFGLLNPFALIAGLVSVSLLVAHGAGMLSMKTEGEPPARAARYGTIAAIVGALLFIAAGVWVATGLTGHHVVPPVVTDGPSSPLLKTVATSAGGWMRNYQEMPLIWLAPASGVVGALGSALFLWRRQGGLAFISSSLALTGVILTVGLSVFPFMLPSSSTPDVGLTLWDASSTKKTLWNMLVVTAIFMPIILGYTTWVYRVLHGKVTPDILGENPNSY